MEEGHHLERWEGYVVDWRKRPALKGQHGGIFAASFVLVVEVLENLAYLATASNLVLYLSEFMHFSPSRSANTVTDFMGTAFLLALVGGFVSDAYFTTYHIFLLSALTEFLGLVILTVQAHIPSLNPPPPCEDLLNTSISCKQVSGSKAAILFGGLYLSAVGVGGIKGSLPVHGAEQFDEHTPQGRKQRSTFFNYFVFCLSCGALVAVTLVVWMEDNKGWQWGFGIATITILSTIPIFLAGSSTYRNKLPTGSPLTTIAEVLAAVVFNTWATRNTSSNTVLSKDSSPTKPKQNKGGEEKTSSRFPNQTLTESFKFLNRAATNKPIHPSLECTIMQVEQVKIVLRMLPIFASTIMPNCCLAQLSTFSVQQAATMNTVIGSLKIPPASLPVFPVLFVMILAPIYDRIIIPLARRVTKTEMGISHLQRIGTGLVFSIVAMAVTALIEIKRKQVAFESNLVDSNDRLPITFLWIALQYLFLGSADLFTLAGLLEFFFTEAPASMRSMATALSWASLALGYYLSSVLVTIVNDVTGTSAKTPWLSGNNLNHYHLDRFYWLMCVLSRLNFLQFIFWANQYKYRPITSQN